MAKYTDKHCRDISLHVGDLVYVSTEHFHWHASYLVSSLHVGLDLFPSVALFLGLHIILTCRRSMGASTLYSMLVISVLIWDQFLLAPPSLLPLDDSAAGEFEVEDILDSRLGQSGPEYLVKWLGYPVFEAMWEPAAHLANAPDILQ